MKGSMLICRITYRPRCKVSVSRVGPATDISAKYNRILIVKLVCFEFQKITITGKNHYYQLLDPKGNQPTNQPTNQEKTRTRDLLKDALLGTVNYVRHK